MPILFERLIRDLREDGPALGNESGLPIGKPAVDGSTVRPLHFFGWILHIGTHGVFKVLRLLPRLLLFRFVNDAGREHQVNMQVVRFFGKCANFVMDSKRIIMVGNHRVDEPAHDFQILLQREFVLQREFELLIPSDGLRGIPVGCPEKLLG